MRNIDHAHALATQQPNALKQCVRIMIGQWRGGLIHDDQAALEGDRPRDLYKLALRQAKLCNRLPCVELASQLLQDTASPRVHLAYVYEPESSGVAPQENILRHAQLRHERQFLVHKADAQRLRITRSIEPNGPVVPKDFSRIRPHHATDDVHERGLARAILAHERMHLGPPQIKVDVVEYPDTTE